MSQSARRPATLADFFAIPEHERFHELYNGQIHQKAAPTGEHGMAQAGVIGGVMPPFQRRVGGSGGPGGWWIASEVEVALLGQVVRPDVVGWRRENCPDRPTGTPVQTQPDWVCEVLSPSNAKEDTVRKLRLYHQAGIAHYWIADPQETTLHIMRHSADGYITLQHAVRRLSVRRRSA